MILENDSILLDYSASRGTSYVLREAELILSGNAGRALRSTLARTGVL